ncbi:MAG: peptidoglycan-binding protein [Leptolyngbya sp. DLM2.Bin15]|nr:MAG: peptidoglycan-binding protein [Leptolyngbya sp. DLM2.Bin15]
MGTLTDNQIPDSLEQFQEKSLNHRSNIIEYFTLSLLDVLTEPQAERLEAILDEATQDTLLSFWIDEVDHIVAHKLNLIDSEFINHQQTALLRKMRNPSSEMEGLVKGLKHSVDQMRCSIQQVLSYVKQENCSQESVQTLQSYLKHEGIYAGEVDGQFGSQTEKALEQLDQLLSDDPSIVPNHCYTRHDPM